MVRSFSSLCLASCLITSTFATDGFSLLQGFKQSKIRTRDVDATATNLTQLLTNENMPWTIVQCIFTCAKGLLINTNCDECADSLLDELSRSANKHIQTTNGVGVKALIDMLSLRKGTYEENWCGKGQLKVCRKKEDFPGPGATSIMGYEQVSKMIADTPQMEWNGKWWRGGELGYIINNPLFWTGLGINPPSIGLGSTAKQHWVVRPYIEKSFTMETRKFQAVKNVERDVDEMIKDFLEDRKVRKAKITIPTDLAILTHQILNKVAFNREVSWEYASAFEKVQASQVGLATISQMIPDALYHDCGWWNLPCKKVREKLDSVRAETKKFVDEYAMLLEDFEEDPAVFKKANQTSWGEQLRDLDHLCEPSDNCLRQLAAATWDAMYAAGGLSVPTNLASGLGVLYSEHDNNPFKDKSSFDPAKNSEEFYWENIRYFSPVVGFPHWEVRPTCEGSTPEETAKLAAPNGDTKPCEWDQEGKNGKPKLINQMQGGKRIIPNIALASQDPEVWGDDSQQFKIRSYHEYEKSVSFAEPAYLPDFQGGRMNRNCPGKSISLIIGKSFFKQFKQEEWHVPDTDENDGKGPKITGGPSWVEGFELMPGSKPENPRERESFDKFVKGGRIVSPDGCSVCMCNSPSLWHPFNGCDPRCGAQCGGECCCMKGVGNCPSEKQVGEALAFMVKINKEH